MAKKHIVISGAGPAGLTLALLLDREKYTITLVEKAKNFHTFGYSIILWRAGYYILEKVVSQKLTSVAHPLNTFSIFGGEQLHQLQSSDTTNVGYSIKRDDLIALLSDAFIDKFSTDTIRFDTVITDVTYENSKPVITLSDSNKLEADLIVAADGMHSGIRNTHFLTKTQSDPFKITYCWLEEGSGLKEEGMIGFTENFLFLLQSVGEKSLLAFYNHGDKNENMQFLNKLNQMLKRERKGKLQINDESVKTFVSETIAVHKAFDRKIVLVGDALHGHPPTLAMGTTLALEDAAALAEGLNNMRNDDAESNYLELTLEKYALQVTKRARSVYTVQDIIEKLLISPNATQIKLVEQFIKFGGWKYIDYTLRQIFSSNKHSNLH